MSANWLGNTSAIQTNASHAWGNLGKGRPTGQDSFLIKALHGVAADLWNPAPEPALEPAPELAPICSEVYTMAEDPQSFAVGEKVDRLHLPSPFTSPGWTRNLNLPGANLLCLLLPKEYQPELDILQESIRNTHE